VTITDDSTTLYDSGTFTSNTAVFEQKSGQFTTGASFDGQVVLTLSNASPGGEGGVTVSYSNVVIEEDTRRWWDGGTDDIGTDGDGASQGGAGTWDTTILNWDKGAEPHVAWNNSNADNAIFGGTPGTVTVSGTIEVGNLHFANNGGYLIDGGTLNFAPGGVISNSYNAANHTITSTITGSPAVHTWDGPGTGYEGLIFAPGTGHTQTLGVITNPINLGTADKAGVYLAGSTTGNSATSISYAGGDKYGTVYKQGTGAWTTGSITTGALRVSDGTLAVNGTVTLDYSGLFMSGTGVLAGDATVFKSDRRAANDFVSGTGISPGNSIGTITFDWGTSGGPNASQWITAFRTGSHYDWELGAGVDNNDVVHIVDGRLIVEGFTLNIIDAGGAPSPADQFAVFTYGSLDSKTLSLGSVVIDTTGALGWDASGASLVDDGSGTIYLTGLSSGGGATPYADWASANSVTQGFDGDDDDGGTSNGFEWYFFGGNPQVAEGWGSPLTGATKTGPTTFQFTHQAVNPRDDVAETYLWSTDLANWYGDGEAGGGYTVDIDPVGNGATPYETVTVTATVSAGGTPPTLFLRLSLSNP
jgi:hypothetical protein